MHPSAEAFVKEWHRVVDARDFSTLSDMLADDVTFRSPAFFKPTQGKLPVGMILMGVGQVLPDLHYTRHFTSEDGAVMEFEATATDETGKARSVQGVDLFALNPEGKVAELTVMIRPLNGLQVLAASMRKLMGG